VATDTSPTRGLTPAEVGRLLRISPDRVRAMIARGELGAIDTTPYCGGRPRYVVLPHHLREWEQAHRAATPQAIPKQRRRKEKVPDYFPHW
jgi:hypothetical protein